MTREETLNCIAHIRAAARHCEDAGMLHAWATLLGVADLLSEGIEPIRTAGRGDSDLRG